MTECTRIPNTSLTPIAIIGSGGFGRELRWLIEDINAQQPRFEILGFVNTDKPSSGPVDGLPVFDAAFFSDPSRFPSRSLAVTLGIGLPAIKRRVALSLPGWVTFPNLIHPSVRMSSRITLGASGIVITAGNILTTSIRIDDHSMINLSCTVGHDASIGAYSVISPGVNISGCVSVGVGASVGTGSKIIEGKRIGEWAVVGAGSVVITDVPPNATAVGAPARVIKTRESGWHEIRSVE